MRRFALLEILDWVGCEREREERGREGRERERRVPS